MSTYRDSERKAIPTLAQQDAIRAQLVAIDELVPA